MNQPVIIDIFANDILPSCGVLSIDPNNMPQHGTVVINDNGTTDLSDDFVTYTPNLDYYGSDTFEYQVCDCSIPEVCKKAIVQINVGVAYPECEVQVFNAVSPDGDGINDILVIWGLDCHPENTVEVYNRWGILVYETQSYGINGNYFRGVSEGRTTLSQGEELPVGTYFYIIRYKDTIDNNSGKEKSGYLYLNKQ